MGTGTAPAAGMKKLLEGVVDVAHQMETIGYL
jgi:hypothetical protein